GLAAAVATELVPLLTNGSPAPAVAAVLLERLPSAAGAAGPSEAAPPPVAGPALEPEQGSGMLLAWSVAVSELVVLVCCCAAARLRRHAGVSPPPSWDGRDLVGSARRRGGGVVRCGALSSDRA
ncbi:unnamed protein product, partial [Prorocentrum cordatum]